MPLKPLCCTVHLEPYESTFSPGKVKHKDIGKEHISAGSSSVHGQSFSTPFQAPWTSSQAEAFCTCMFFQQKGTMHGRLSPIKEDQAMHWLLKHGNKSFPASPVPWSLNGMACPVVLSAIRGGTLEEWHQIILSLSTWEVCLNCFHPSRLLGQNCHLKPSRQGPIEISRTHWSWRLSLMKQPLLVCQKQN